MNRYRTAALFATLATVAISTTASASDARNSCTGFSKFGAQRAVSGDVVAAERDRLGVSHIVVLDKSTGCRVYALSADLQNCSSGRHFEGLGRLRTDFKGSDYDATLALGRDKGACS